MERTTPSNTLGPHVSSDAATLKATVCNGGGMRWASVAVLLCVSALLLSCAPVRPADPTEAIVRLKAACNAACAGTQDASVTLPAGWSLRADPDGVCLRKDDRLLCGTCDCDTYGLLDTELAPAGMERGITCRFAGDPDMGTLTATCG